MEIMGIAFLGMRTDRYHDTVRLFRDVMGMTQTRQESDLTGLQAGSGITVEVYGPADDFHTFFRTGPVIGFRVADFDAAYAEMTAAGVQFIGPIQHHDGVSWNHFHAPDGTVFEILGPGQPPPTPS